MLSNYQQICNSIGMESVTDKPGSPRSPFLPGSPLLPLIPSNPGGP